MGVKSLASCDHGLGPNLTRERAFADVDNHRHGVLVDGATNAPVDGEIKLSSSEDLSCLVLLEFAYGGVWRRQRRQIDIQR
jgi:hypothetical protein